MASYASENGADLCVLGSGVAGMLVAERALERGRRVLMVERGTPMSFEDRRRQGSHEDPLPFNKTRHASAMPGGEEYLARPVYNLGGSMNHFYGNMPRMHPRHFEEDAFGGVGRRWPISYGEIEPYYLEAERRLLISGNSERTPFPGRFDYPLPPHRLSPSDRACEQIYGPEYVMQIPTVRPPEEVEGRPRCCGTNLCGLCPIDSKGTALNTVYPALRERVELQTGLMVTELHCAGGRVVALTAVDEAGDRHRIEAREFVVACNGIDSCLLLLRSADVPTHPALGRHYMDHPAFDLAVYGTSLETKPGYGDSAQTGMITSFFERVADDLPVSLLGEIKCAELSKDAGDENRDRVVRDVFQLSVEGRFSEARELRARFRQNWGTTLFLRFLVEALPRPDSTLSMRTIADSGQALPEIAARYPDYMDACIDRVLTDLRERLPGAEVKYLSRSPTVQHWLGATRMAESPEHGCVDRDLRYFGLDNLFILSGSSYTSGSSANPTNTLAALALRLGDHLGAGRAL